MQQYTRVLGIVFGMMMLALSAAITAETLMRKLLSISLGGIDELGGYAIAIAAPLAFTVALADRAHIRISQLTNLLPMRVQAVLDVVSVVSLAALSVFFLHFAIQTVLDTWTYKSIAQTPWATPLIVPQGIWLVAMATFPLAAIWLGLRALHLLARRDWRQIRKEFGTPSANEELQAELEDLKRREAETGLQEVRT
ncbi:TRAP transporter small permease subunit [Paracoccus aestuariivivens]|uniref:TRAP transporter small permease protein n=1 Tax=Paracoccus aestuariivivens TaxID=1820333 RepID=A0A6L6J8Q6_9RHOB|nr:TRAP transporter small permease [Paracoccus aestuariivivens]MTH78380.1 TRAP transporter small permease subunit [Paracoccus aestuariivivens]